jgi:hypothetical protein
LRSASSGNRSAAAVSRRGLELSLLALVQIAGVWFIYGAVARSIRSSLPAFERRKRPRASGSHQGRARCNSQARIGWCAIRLSRMVLIVLGVSHMTGDRLAFAIVSSLYLIVAVPWEERR